MSPEVKEAIDRRRALLRKFDLGTPIAGEPLSTEIRTDLEFNADQFQGALSQGAFYLDLEKRKFGGSLMPHEDKIQQYFKTVVTKDVK